MWRGVAEGTAGETGSEFFAHLTRSLSQTIHTFGAWITEWRPTERRLHSYSMYLDKAFVEDFNYDVAGTPCERVVEQKGSLIHIEDNIIDLYPQNQVVQATRAVSFMGIALVDLDDTVLGHLAVLDTKPMPADIRLEALFRVFSARAAAELRRLRAKRELAAREAQPARLIDGAMDAIVELDEHLGITHANRAAEAVFGAEASHLEARRFSSFLNEESTEKLCGLARALDARPTGKRANWVAGGLIARTASGAQFPAEATLSRSQDTEGAVHYTLVLRNVNERTEAERAIEALASEAADRPINRLRLTMRRRYHARSSRRTDAGVRRVTCCAQSCRFGTAQDGTAVEFRSLRAAFRRTSPSADEPCNRPDKKHRAPKLGTLGWFVESIRDRGRAEGDLERIAAVASDRESARRDSIQSPHRSA